MKNILISGAGIAGLSLAYWLKQYGFRPTVVEKQPTLRAEGYKIDIRGVAVDVVKRMNLWQTICQHRTAIKESRFVNRSGKTISEVHPDLCGARVEGDLEIVRGKLCEILYEHMGNVECLFGDSITKISQDEKQTFVEFEKESPRTFDMIIGADGLHSHVRKLVWGDETQFLNKLGLNISFYSIPNYLNLDHVEIEYHSPQKFAIVYCPRDGLAKAGFAFVAKPNELNLRDKALQQQSLRNAFQDCSWEIPKLLEFMEDTPDFFYDCMAQVHMPKWSKGRVTLAGDAAYAVSPVAGQGASVALVGAYVLAGELARASGDYLVAFENYETCLREYIKENQDLAKMSVSILKGDRSSWLATKIMWLTLRIGQLLPASWIRFWKKQGQKRTAKAANALTLKDYSSLVAHAASQVVVDKANSLHKGVDDGRANEAHPSPL